MSTTITNLPETSKVNGSDYLVLDQPDKTVKSTVSNFLTDTGVVLATQLKDTNGADLIQSSNGNTVQEELNNNLLNDREQWRRSLAEAGLTLVDGSFEEGATVGSVTDAVWHIAGGQCYTWDGALPKTVPADSTPESSGGVGGRKWVSVGDASLKTMLYGWQGYSFIDGGNLSLYKKKGIFGDSGAIQDKYEVIKYSDGFWYKYNNSLPFSYGSAPDSTWTNVGKLNGFDENTPENFGAVVNNSTYDCLDAINKAMATGFLRLTAGATYFVSDEVVIPSNLVMETNGATIKAMSGYSWGGKAVVRASKKPVGTSPDLSLPEQQVRGIRHIGTLNIDANNVAPYGFYGFGVVAESTTDIIYAYNATEVGIVLLGSWYHKVNQYMAIDCARGVSLAHGFSGETGDVNVNGVEFGVVAAYNTSKSLSYGYDPYSSSLTPQLIGAGVTLGQGLASRIGTLIAETTAGAGLATVNAVSWSVGSMYFGKCSEALEDSAEPDIAILSTTGNVEDHVFDVGNIHFGIGTGILQRATASEFLNIQSIYRIDNKKTWHSSSKASSSFVNFVNYYVLNPYDYVKPAQLTTDVGKEVVSSSSMLNFKDFSNTPSIPFVYTGGEIAIHVSISSGSVVSTEFQVTSDSGIEYITCTGSPFQFNLTQPRTVGNTYTVTLATAQSAASGQGAIHILKQKPSQWLR
ncbi:tail spike protein [Escherichia phage vB_EcoM_UP17]|nr:tail spike protein [Escherichia phage vB_EcoM_UP17]